MAEPIRMTISMEILQTWADMCLGHLLQLTLLELGMS